MKKSVFEPSIEIVTQKHLFGNWMTLEDETLDHDYELIWQALEARLRPVAGQVRNRFGLGRGVRQGGPFRYWTAVELRPGAPAPAGMAAITIPAGLYLALDKGPGTSLDAAYDFVYNSWEDPIFAVNRSRLCFEQYGSADREKTTLFMPLDCRVAWAEADGEFRPVVGEVG